MKITHRTEPQAAVLLVILVLIFLLLFLGFTVWQIWKIIQQIPDAPKNSNDVTAGEMIADFQSNHVETISSVSTQMLTISVVQPFDPSTVSVRVWRSTNLVNWDCIATNQAGEQWTDTNAPWPNGFYFREIIK